MQKYRGTCLVWIVGSSDSCIFRIFIAHPITPRMGPQKEKDILSFLKKVALFSEVTEASLTHLYANLSTQLFERNDTIIKKGDTGSVMYIIAEGVVSVHDKEHEYMQLTATDCFGEYALIDEEPRSASVKALAPTRVFCLPGSYFMALLGKDKGFTKGILSVLIKRHRELDLIQERLAVSKQELELANGKMGGLINGAMDSIVMFDSNFRILLANPSAHSILENQEVLQRNILFFLDEPSASMLENLVLGNLDGNQDEMNTFVPEIVKVIGSSGTETLNEGTISTYGIGKTNFYTLILRNIEKRLKAENKINLLTNQTQYLESEIKELTNSYGIVTADKSMRKVMDLIQQVAITDATVLIQGETGTGKELVARAIHQASDRKAQPLIRINCGAIPANLIESELFGHEKGAFTGATSNRKGRFLLADKGTIFLDEIGELPLALQPKLLRVIQEGEFDPVGSSVTIKVDVRIIAATHRDLLKKSKIGEFREDLYYRLNVFPILVPPLRKRGDDVCLIANTMMRRYAEKMNREVHLLTEAQRPIFQNYDWPGNVRELQNLIERAVIVAKNGTVDWTHIIPNSGGHIGSKEREVPDKILTSEEIVRFEKENILKALKQTRWKVSGKNGAAALLEIPPTTLTSKIKALGISKIP